MCDFIIVKKDLSELALAIYLEAERQDLQNKCLELLDGMAQYEPPKNSKEWNSKIGREYAKIVDAYTANVIKYQLDYNMLPTWDWHTKRGPLDG